MYKENVLINGQYFVDEGDEHLIPIGLQYANLILALRGVTQTAEDWKDLLNSYEKSPDELWLYELVDRIGLTNALNPDTRVTISYRDGYLELTYLGGLHRIKTPMTIFLGTIFSRDRARVTIDTMEEAKFLASQIQYLEDIETDEHQFIQGLINQGIEAGDPEMIFGGEC